MDFQAEDVAGARAQSCEQERYYGHWRWFGYLEPKVKGEKMSYQRGLCMTYKEILNLHRWQLGALVGL